MASIKTISLTKEEDERLRELFRAHKDHGQRYIKTSPGNQILPSTFEKFKDEFYNMEVRSDDVFVFGWPKNGSVWLAEMVWCIKNGFDFDKAGSLPFPYKIPYIDLICMAEAFKGVFPVEPFLNILSQTGEMDSPRTIRSHLSFDLMPPNMLDKSKVLVVLRNPKDTIVSYYHHERLLKLFSFCGDFPAYFDVFMDGLVAWGSYWEYTKEVWKKRDHPNMCLLFYEDMKRDLGACIKKVAQFLQAEVSEDQVELLKDYLSFDKMKDNPSVNLEPFRDTIFNDIEGGRYIRKGEVGDWKNYFTEEMNKRVDEAVDTYFKGTGLTFTYEL